MLLHFVLNYTVYCYYCECTVHCTVTVPCTISVTVNAPHTCAIVVVVACPPCKATGPLARC